MMYVGFLCFSLEKDSSTALIALILIQILLGLAILFFILWRKGTFTGKYTFPSELKMICLN